MKPREMKSGLTEMPAWERLGLKEDSILKIGWGVIQAAKPGVRKRFVAVLKEMLPALIPKPSSKENL